MIKLLYSPQYDYLALAIPIKKWSRYYTLESCSWGSGSTDTYTMKFLKKTANFVEIDKWKENVIEEAEDYHPSTVGDYMDNEDRRS